MWLVQISGKTVKKLQKNLQKGVDIRFSLWYYIQVDAIRHRMRAKVARSVGP